MKTVQVVETDVLVIGGGGAGLRAAIVARKHGLNVLLVSKSRVGYGNNTAIAKGALAATGWAESEDSPEEHFRDTIKAGCFINNRRLLDVMVRGAKQQVLNLLECGVKLQKQDGKLAFRPTPGHTYSRTLYNLRFLGVDFTQPMVDYAQREGVQFMSGILIINLLKVDGVVNGAVGLDRSGQVVVFNAKSIVLATGGLGRLFLRTNNAAGTKGTGYWLAYEVGSPLLDMEFTQFYPTAFAEHDGFQQVVYEGFVVRAGALIKNALGEDILEKYGIKDPLVMTRDKLARAMMLEILQGRGKNGFMIMDLSPLTERVRDKMSMFLPKEVRAGVTEVLVAPTTHFQSGGVKIDERGGTTVGGLYAAGEVCGGVHGANRLGANAITEIFVFGEVAGESAAKNALEAKLIPVRESKISDETRKLESLTSSDGDDSVEELEKLLRTVMWYKAGVVRDEASLKSALEEISSIRDRLKRAPVVNQHQLVGAIELSGMLTVAEMMCRAALMRTESRGVHYRSDYPEEDDQQWLKNIVVSSHQGNMFLETVPVEGDGEYPKPS